MARSPSALQKTLKGVREKFRRARDRFRAWRRRHEQARDKRRKRRKAGKPTKAADKRVKRARRKRKHWWARTKWFVKRKTVLRRKIKRAKKRAEKADPEFEPWMANGYPYEGLSPALRKFIAIAVVRYDLYVTSTKRNWGTGSYHDIWRAIDVAGAWDDMLAFQRSISCDEVSEMFGPDNDRNCKNGVRISQAEGSPNEELHDTHVHVGI